MYVPVVPFAQGHTRNAPAALHAAMADYEVRATRRARAHCAAFARCNARCRRCVQKADDIDHEEPPAAMEEEAPAQLKSEVAVGKRQKARVWCCVASHA